MPAVLASEDGRVLLGLARRARYRLRVSERRRDVAHRTLCRLTVSWSVRPSGCHGVQRHLCSILAPLEADIDSIASAVLQVYKTLSDHLSNAYTYFPAQEGRKIFPAIVTLENWRIFGPVMMNKLSESVASKLKGAGVSETLVEEMPYSVWSIEELEVGLQIMRTNGIAAFMEGKLQSAEMRQWDWHGYMTNRYPKSFPAKKLFKKEHDEMFSALYAAQHAAT